jgi:Predicted transcriptional regulators
MKRMKLLEARKNAHMTQVAVAAIVGVSKQQYSRIENGEQIGSVRVWDALEDLFGIPQRQLREQQSAPGGNPALDE